MNNNVITKAKVIMVTAHTPTYYSTLLKFQERIGQYVTVLDRDTNWKTYWDITLKVCDGPWYLIKFDDCVITSLCEHNLQLD
ncbi:MAG: hypothetical protein WD512_11585 [Candidatus Paceibacterota bacterium]